MRFEGVRSPSRGAGPQNLSVQNVFHKRVLLLFIQHRTSSTCTGAFLGSGTETGGRGVRPGGGRGRAWGSIPRLSPAQKVLQEEPTSILYMALGGMVGAVAAGQLTVLLAGGTTLLSSAAAPPIRGELLFPTAGQLTHLSRRHLGA